MSYAPGPWTVVARDADGDPVEWCTHLHDNGDEANECLWEPLTPGLRLHCEPMVWFDDFDPQACTACTHDLHPAECQRCLESWECIHLNPPQECERCHDYESYRRTGRRDATAGDPAGDQETPGDDRVDGDVGHRTQDGGEAPRADSEERE